MVVSQTHPRSSKIKYEAVLTDTNEETREFDPIKRSLINTACCWSTLLTTVLIGTYYIPSICLTFYQRWLFQNFHFPLTTVVIHMMVKFILAALIRVFLMRKYEKTRTMFGWREYVKTVAPVGIFSGLDIGLSNWGLELIQVSLYTMTKSTTIVFILAFSILFKLEKKSWSLCFIVIMITTGLILFTYKATHFDLFGFILLLLASISSGVRWTFIQLLLQKAKSGMKNPIDMIYHMQPWMILSVIPFAVWMEGPNVIRNCQLLRFKDTTIVLHAIYKILLGAFIAFFMEVAEVMVVRYTSSLTLAIAGIFKEVLILVLAVEWNGDQMSPINVVGLLICLAGIISHVIHKLRTTPPRKLGRIYEAESELNELGEQLINDDLLTSDSDNENNRHDTQILFDILNSRDR